MKNLLKKKLVKVLSQRIIITISTTATDTQTKTIGAQIRELGAKGDEVAAIWEPNHKEHTAYVVANNGRGITSTSEEVDTYGVKVAVASAATKEIANINSTTDSNLVAVNTFTPNYTTAAGGVDEKTIITNTAGNNLGIAPNQISKVRVYVWLEGQDPDCIDLASTGDKLNVTLKLTKDKTTSTDKNNYIGKGTNTPAQTGEKITANEVMPSDYGTKVTNYASDTSAAQKSVHWRIFHTDGTNIYLIADNCIENTYKPAGKGGTNYINTSGTYGADLNAQNDYAGSNDITESHPAKKWLSKYTYESTNHHNMNATAYLLDTSVWNPVFVNSNYAEYAIGGPTLELFAASYNATHTDKTIDTQVSSATGYQVKWSTDASYANHIDGLNSSEELYVISNLYGNTIYGMWVASPSNNNMSHVMIIVNSGSVGYNYLGNKGVGIRPVVCLKSSVQLEKQEDGSVKIVE